MKKRILTSLLLLMAFIPGKGQGYMRYVDTRVGTAASQTKTAGKFGKGSEEYAHTLPAVLEPHGMTFWTPQTAEATEKKGVCPYLYKHDKLKGFRSSHWIVGGATQDYGSFTLFPSNSPQSFDSNFSHDTEIATPAYYSVRLNDSGIQTEMTGKSHSAIFRFTFPDPSAAYLILTVNSDENEGELGVNLQQNSLWAKNPVHRIYQGKGLPTGFCGWFYVQLQDGELEDYGKLNDQLLWVKLKPSGNKVVLKAGTSFTSLQNAEQNLQTEIPHFLFEKTRQELTKLWEKHLSIVQVTSNDTEELGKFYGSLYRASFLPHAINDCNGDYPRFANGTIVENSQGRLYYDDFSMWDTYRALHPLLTLLWPSMDGDMMQSLVTKYEQGGWLPIFPCWGSYTAAMIGDHCTTAIADAYVKGIHNFDIKTAYEAMRKNAFESPVTYEEYTNGMGRRALKSYLKHGYIPLEDSVKEAYHKQEQVSRTLEYAFDDFTLAQVAKKLLSTSLNGLDKKQLRNDYKELMRRSKNWKNVLDPTSGWVNGRHADGSFLHPADSPYSFAQFITEGTPCHYSWYVPQDIPNLIKAMGGKKNFESKLDEMFNDGLYWHGNEPCHQIAYLYNFIGKPEKTQRALRHILSTEYMNMPGGLSGNDDAGQMSAWYIFSALGFYPVCPGVASYSLGSPIFPKVVIQLENGKSLTIEAENSSPENIYAKRITFNGKKLKDFSITHEALQNGGLLKFQMTSSTQK